MQISSVFSRSANYSKQIANTSTPPVKTENKADVFQPIHKQTVRFSGAKENKGLCEAIDQADESTAREWLEKGADIDAINDNGGTLLTRAVLQRKRSTISLIKKLGADMDKPNRHKWTPLNLAVSQGDVETITQLLGYGVDPYAFSQNGQNAMTTAASLGQLDAINALHKLKVSVNRKDGKLCSPLAMAVFHNQLATIKLLYLLGADINKKMPNGMTLAEYAEFKKHPEAQKLIQELVKEKALINLIGHQASSQETENLLEVLFKNEQLSNLFLGLNSDSSNADPAVGKACMNSYIEALLQENPSSDNGTKSTNQLVVELLHNKAGIPIPLELSNGKSTLHEAVRHNQPYLFNTILSELSQEEKATLINKKDHLGLTALQRATKTATRSKYEANKQIHIDQAKTLLDHGADPLILDEFGESALDYLADRQHKHALNDLLKHYKPANLNCIDQLVHNNTLSGFQKTNTALHLQATSGIELRRNNDSPKGNVKLEAGNSLEVNNQLYRVTPDLRLVKVSDDAAKIRFLFPKGIHDLHYSQGQIGDCGILTEMQALIDDPSGIGPRAVLDRFKISDDRIEISFQDDVETFNMSELSKTAGNEYQYTRKEDEPEVVNGPLGLQLLERSHFRKVRRSEMAKQQKDNISDIASTVGTLNEKITNKNTKSSSEFGIALLGKGFWKPVMVDGSKHSTLIQRIFWSHKRTKPFQDKTGDEKSCIDDFIEQFRQNPASFRGVVGTKYAETEDAATDEIRIPLEDANEHPNSQSYLYTTHGYYLKNISKHPDRSEFVYEVRNPHKGGKPLYLSERDFKKNIYFFDGLAPRVDGLVPQANGYSKRKSSKN